MWRPLWVSLGPLSIVHSYPHHVALWVKKMKHALRQFFPLFSFWGLFLKHKTAEWLLFCYDAKT